MAYKLRLFREEDFEALHAIVSDYEVVKMLGSWPYPADPDFTRMRMETPEVRAGQVLVIEVDGAPAGTISGVKGGIGYMLGREYWGRGVATWAVGKMVTRMFQGSDIMAISASAWIDNPASIRVLEKCGFRRVGAGEDMCKARGRMVRYEEFRIERNG